MVTNIVFLGALALVGFFIWFFIWLFIWQSKLIGAAWPRSE